jgi:general secretion pathway protein D
MHRNYGLVFVSSAILLAAASPVAEEAVVADILPRVSLVEVLDAVSENDGRTFIIDHRAVPAIVVGQLESSSMNYPQLLAVLRDNGLAAVHADGGLISIVPVQVVRQRALPVLRKPDPDMADDEWVTWQVTVENGHAAHYVPIMRPLLPQAGHLAAEPASNTITIVDRYANARRIVGLIEAMDAATAPDGQETE